MHALNLRPEGFAFAEASHEGDVGQLPPHVAQLCAALAPGSDVYEQRVGAGRARIWRYGRVGDRRGELGLRNLGIYPTNRVVVFSGMSRVGHDTNHRRLPGGTTTPLQRSRHAAGIRQVDIAERAGVHLNTIRLLEANAHVPTVKTAVAISRALGYRSPLDLFPDLRRCPGGEAGR